MMIKHSWRCLVAATALAIGPGLAGCQPGIDATTHAALQQELDALKSEAARTEANKQLVLEAWHTIFTEKKVGEGFDRYIHPDYIQHNPVAADGPAPARKFLTEWFEKNPDAIIEVKKAVAEGDLVFIHHHMRASPKERGNAAVDMFRVQDGKLIEHWDVLQAIPEKSANPHPMF